MSDLATKLRSYNPTSGYSRVMREAADRIEELEAENERLQAEADRLTRAKNPLALIADRQRAERKLERLIGNMLQLAESLERNDEPGWADMIRANTIVKE